MQKSDVFFWKKANAHEETTEKIEEEPAVAPINADVNTGLTAEQVAQRCEAGLVNRAATTPTKSEAQIIKENIFTYFNLIFIVLAGCLAAVGSYLNMGFLGVVICNTVIGIVQQLRSKKTIDQLTLVSAHKVHCLRDGHMTMLPSDELVRDDLVEFSAGEQICADAVVRSGDAQANEALVTGEAKPVAKAPGDALKSGSFLASGRCLAQLTCVGADSYANRLATEAKSNHVVAKGKMMRSLDGLIRVIGVLLVPMGGLLFYRQYATLAMPARDAVEATVAALIGMIPEGLYLLTSVALAVSMVRLAQRKVLAQDMNCIETLARVDVLCVDKTGTITENHMEAGEPLLLCAEKWSEGKTAALLYSLYSRTEPDNDTASALVAKFGTDAPQPRDKWKKTAAVPFNSAYKWSAVTFEGQGSFVIGAPEFVAGNRYTELRDKVEPEQTKGGRVLLLAAYDGKPDPEAGLQTDKLQFIALLPVANRIRPDAPQTFRYFAEQGVEVKVISGDNPLTVSEVARQADIADAENYVDASTLKNEADVAAAATKYTVFGRVSPDQKRMLVKALQAAGHTVAMTGDGVNDVLALKDADCGIAMASGAQAASQVAQLVLLQSDFSALPEVVAEGRRVINNIQRSASLFLVKNIFSFTFALFTLFFGVPFPLQPLQLSLIAGITIGTPAFFLALEPNRELVRGNFILNVLKAALPGGLTNLVLVLGLAAFTEAFSLPYETLSTLTTLLMLAVGMAVLWHVCQPLNLLHGAIWGGMLVLAGVCLVLFGKFIGLVPLDARGLLILGVFVLLVVQTLRWLTAAAGAGERGLYFLKSKFRKELKKIAE